MTSEITPTTACCENNKMDYHGGSSEAAYGLGLIGAWVYYIGRAHDFRQGLLGFFKAFFWPAFLVYALLKFLEKE